MFLIALFSVTFVVCPIAVIFEAGVLCIMTITFLSLFCIFSREASTLRW